MIIAYVKAITIMMGKELNLSAYVILILGSFIMIMSCCTVCFKYGRDIWFDKYNNTVSYSIMTLMQFRPLSFHTGMLNGQTFLDFMSLQQMKEFDI